MKQYGIVFAGQGAQAVGMGRDLAEASPEVRALFAEADRVLGYDLTRIVFEGPLEELTKTRHCQPAIFMVSAACWQMLKQRVPGLSVAGVAGLSLGEWTALYAAGVLSYADTLRVLEARGRFMQEACEEKPGGMLSVMGLTAEKLQEISVAAGVEIANLNSPDQTVLSGEKAGIAEADRLAQAAGAKRTVVLNVAGAYHSRLMASAAARLGEVLAGMTFQAPQVPVISNTTGLPHGGPEEIKAAMLRQITSSVQWIRSIEWFRQKGVKDYVECGPGKVLAGLIKRIDKDSGPLNIQDAASLEKTVAAAQA